MPSPADIDLIAAGWKANGDGTFTNTTTFTYIGIGEGTVIVPAGVTRTKDIAQEYESQRPKKDK